MNGKDLAFFYGTLSEAEVVERWPEADMEYIGPATLHGIRKVGNNIKPGSQDSRVDGSLFYVRNWRPIDEFERRFNYGRQQIELDDGRVLHVYEAPRNMASINEDTSAQLEVHGEV